MCTLRTCGRTERPARPAVSADEVGPPGEVAVDVRGGPPDQLARRPLPADHLDDRLGEPGGPAPYLVVGDMGHPGASADVELRGVRQPRLGGEQVEGEGALDHGCLG